VINEANTTNRLMAEVAELYKKGIIKPIDRITTFDISQLQQALMFMSKGKHIGKVVVTYNNPDSLLKVVPSAPRANFDPNASYLLVGCIGGLGQSIGRWMIDRGAKHLFYISRSGPAAPEAAMLAESAKELDVTISVMKCDITKKSNVNATVSQIAQNRPIRGVFQAAAVFDDVSFENMEFEQMQKVLGPKVTGTVNLHEATIDQPLDFFTMTSSIVSVIGTATQSSYSAANSFQDAFARWRVSQGHPAQSLALGMILGVGFASSRDDIQRSLIRNGVYGTSESELIRLLDIAFTAPRLSINESFDPWAGAHLLSGIEPSKVYELDKSGQGKDFAWSVDPRFGGILQAIQDHHESTEQMNNKNLPPHTSASKIGDLYTLAKSALSAPQPSADQLQSLHNIANIAVAERLAKLLFLTPDDVDISKDMTSYGIDSMISAELRNWLFKTFGLDVAFTELARKGMKVEELSKRIVSKLLSKGED
jgi:aryl carrier-like protein